MQDAPDMAADITVGADGTAIVAKPTWSLTITVAIVVCTLAVIGLAGAQAYFDWNAALQLRPM